jgi:predicted class III extradiol MEMO1 family dioxygenase
MIRDYTNIAANERTFLTGSDRHCGHRSRLSLSDSSFLLTIAGAVTVDAERCTSIGNIRRAVTVARRSSAQASC